MERLEKDQIQLMGIISSLKAQRDFECLKGEPEYFVGLSEASDELKAVNSQKMSSKRLSGQWRMGSIRS